MQRQAAILLQRLAGAASSTRTAAAACSPAAQHSFTSSAAAGDSSDDSAAAAGPLFYEATYDPAARNSVTVTGVVLADPAAASLHTSGVRVLKFPLGNKVGMRKNSFMVETYKDLAEQAEGHLAKGTRVVIHGWLKQDTWTNKATGEPRSRVLVVARRIGVLPKYDVPEGTSSSNGGSGGSNQGEP